MPRYHPPCGNLNHHGYDRPAPVSTEREPPSADAGESAAGPMFQGMPHDPAQPLPDFRTGDMLPQVAKWATDDPLTSYACDAPRAVTLTMMDTSYVYDLLGHFHRTPLSPDCRYDAPRQPHTDIVPSPPPAPVIPQPFALHGTRPAVRNAANPIKYRDPSGTIVVYYNGAPINGPQDDLQLNEIVPAKFPNQQKPIILHNSSWTQAVDQVINQHKDHPCEPVVVAGYSNGGSAAVLLAWRLNEAKVNVQLLLTIDPVQIWFYRDTRVIPPNVQYNLNLYQRDDWLIRGEYNYRDGKDGVVDPSDNIENVQMHPVSFPIIAMHLQQFLDVKKDRAQKAILAALAQKYS